MKKTIATAVMILQCLTLQTSYAQTSPIQDIDYAKDPLFENGFVELPKNLIVEADEQHKIVRYFMDFSCVYCRSLKSVMDTWGNTLAEGYTLVYHHIGASNSPFYYLQSASLTYVMNSDLTYGKKQQFIDSMFTHIGKVQTIKELTRLIKEAAADVGLEHRPLAEYIMSDQAPEDYKAAIELQRSINVQVTPSILIGGKYLTHLGLTDGTPARWIELINKVTSIDIYTRANTLTPIHNPTLQALPLKD